MIGLMSNHRVHVLCNGKHQIHAVSVIQLFESKLPDALVNELAEKIIRESFAKDGIEYIDCEHSGNKAMIDKSELHEHQNGEIVSFGVFMHIG